MLIPIELANKGLKGWGEGQQLEGETTPSTPTEPHFDKVFTMVTVPVAMVDKVRLGWRGTCNLDWFPKLFQSQANWPMVLLTVPCVSEFCWQCNESHQYPRVWQLWREYCLDASWVPQGRAPVCRGSCGTAQRIAGAQNAKPPVHWFCVEVKYLLRSS